MKKNKDLFYTFITQAILTVLNILLLRLFAYNYSEEDFGCYLVIRRTIGLIFPIVIINLNLSLARNISKDLKQSGNYLIGAIFILLVSSAFLFTLTTVFKYSIAKLLFGNRTYSYILLPFILYLFSNCYQLLVAGFFRGKHNFYKMNLSMLLIWIIQVIILSISVFGGFDLRVDKFLYISSFGILFLYSSLLIGEIDFNYFKNQSIIENIHFSSEFMRYGIQRIPNGFFLGGIYSIPVIFTTNFISIKQSAYVGVFVSVFRMLQQIGYPLNMLFVPKFAKKMFENDIITIKKQVATIFDILFSFPVLIGAFLSYFAPELITLWFGDKYSTIIPYFIYLSPSVILILAYILIRGVLDGLYTFPYSNIITFAGFVTTILGLVITYIFNFSIGAIVFSFIAGASICGVISIFILSKSLKVKIFNKKRMFGLAWGVVIYLILFLMPKFEFSNVIYIILLKILISIVVFIISIIIYFKRGDFDYLLGKELMHEK